MTGRCACARSPKDGMLLWELSAMRLLQNPMGTQGQLHVPREGASILLISRGPPSPNVIFASSASASPILSKKTLMFSSKLPPPLKTLASDQQMSPHRRSPRDRVRMLEVFRVIFLSFFVSHSLFCSGWCLTLMVARALMHCPHPLRHPRLVCQMFSCLLLWQSSRGGCPQPWSPLSTTDAWIRPKAIHRVT
jgi:hypothetical protein